MQSGSHKQRDMLFETTVVEEQQWRLLCESGGTDSTSEKAYMGSQDQQESVHFVLFPWLFEEQHR